MTNEIPKQKAAFPKVVDEVPKFINDAKTTILNGASNSIKGFQKGASDYWQRIIDPTGEQANKEFIRKTMDANVPQVGTSITAERVIDKSNLPEYIQNIPSQESN